MLARHLRILAIAVNALLLMSQIEAQGLWSADTVKVVESSKGQFHFITHSSGQEWAEVDSVLASSIAEAVLCFLFIDPDGVPQVLIAVSELEVDEQMNDFIGDQVVMYPIAVQEYGHDRSLRISLNAASTVVSDYMAIPSGVSFLDSKPHGRVSNAYFDARTGNFIIEYQDLATQKTDLVLFELTKEGYPLTKFLHFQDFKR